MAFDLAAYLARIALKVAPEPDVEGLIALQRAHRLAIPFENLDVILGRRIAIDSDAVFAKLVTARRGGFCFEHDRLFRDALAALGFIARPLLARVRLGTDQVTPRTHVLGLVEIDGQPWIADTGFGGSYSPPMPLADGVEATAPDGARFRLDRDSVHGWMLRRHGPAGSTDGRGAADGWQPQYSVALDPVFDADLAMGAHFAATAPGSRFVTVRVVSLPLPSGFASLTDALYRRHTGDKTVEATITDPRVYRMRLAMMFGIELDEPDIAALGLFG